MVQGTSTKMEEKREEKRKKKKTSPTKKKKYKKNDIQVGVTVNKSGCFLLPLSCGYFKHPIYLQNNSIRRGSPSAMILISFMKFCSLVTLHGCTAGT